MLIHETCKGYSPSIDKTSSHLAELDTNHGTGRSSVREVSAPSIVVEKLPAVTQEEAEVSNIFHVYYLLA
jgi:hypothetical protein